MSSFQNNVDIKDHDASSVGLKLAGTLVTATAAELNTVDGATAGTVVASKAVVVDSNKDIAAFRNVTVTNIDAGASGTAGSVDIFPSTASKGKITIAAVDNTNNDALTITNVAQAAARTYTLGDVGASGGFAILGATPTAVIGSTPAEIDLQCDISLQTETIDVSTACSVTKRITKIASTGAGAVTLAAPDASMLGQVKIIEHISGAHDVTLSLANVTGGSAATTCTFSDDNDALVLVGGTNKWHVIAESGVVLS